MIRPTAHAIILHGLSTLALVILLIVWPAWTTLWAITAALLWAVTLLDALTLIGSKKRLDATLHPEARMSLGYAHTLHVQLSNRATHRRFRGSLHLQTDGALTHAPESFWSAPSQSRTVLEVPLNAWRRGRGTIAHAELRILSRLQLLERRQRLSTNGVQTDVYANLHVVQQAAQRNTTLRSYLQGLRVQKRIGDGQAFEALRSFQPGHDTRAIDWSVSARMRELHVREFKEERNHSIALAFDTGRMMCRDIDGITRLDHALNASMHLSYVALRMGDRVGMLGFDEVIHRWSAPRDGIETLRHLTEEAQHLPYTLNVPNLRGASVHLHQKLPRRSILFFFTDIDGSQDPRALLEALAPLHKKHQVHVVTLQDAPRQNYGALRRDEDIDTALAHATLLRKREGALRALRARGIRIIDATPETLPNALLEHYQDVKQRGLA